MRSRSPAPLTGLLWGAIFALPALAFMTLGLALAGLSVLPLRLFDWMARYLPAAVLNFGRDVIGTLAGQFRLAGSTSETAKLAEQIMGYGLLLAVLAAAGGVFFLLMNRIAALRPKATDNPIVPGVVLGVLVALPLVLMDGAVGQTGGESGPVSTVWNIGLLVLWAMAVYTLYLRLLALADRAVTRPAASTLDVEAIDRRNFLIRMGGAAAALTVVGSGLSALLSRTDALGVSGGTALQPTPGAGGAALPNAADLVQPVFGTRPEVTPLAQHYRIDISTLPPTIEEAGYRLPFTSAIGQTGEPAEIGALTLDEIRAMPVDEQFITMSCISNPIGGDLISTIKWTGTSMQNVLARIAPPEGATHLKITGADGFDETVAIDLISSDPRIMLSYAWEDQPLPAKHGFPLRIHIPDLYGMKQPKWITGIEFIPEDQDGYWVRRSWSKEARVLATSVIDTVAVEDAFEADGTVFVPIGGIAWAGARGLSAVEVRVDEGAWQPAALRAPISDRTWQIWRYDWPFSPGQHTFEVRCAEADGTPQIETPARTFPDGATGIHSRRAQLPDDAAALLAMPERTPVSTPDV
jgi:hypothetical protein